MTKLENNINETEQQKQKNNILALLTEISKTKDLTLEKIRKGKLRILLYTTLTSAVAATPLAYIATKTTDTLIQYILEGTGLSEKERTEAEKELKKSLETRAEARQKGFISKTIERIERYSNKDSEKGIVRKSGDGMQAELKALQKYKEIEVYLNVKSYIAHWIGIFTLIVSLMSRVLLNRQMESYVAQENDNIQNVAYITKLISEMLDSNELNDRTDAASLREALENIKLLTERIERLEEKDLISTDPNDTKDTLAARLASEAAEVVDTTLDLTLK